MQVSNWPYKYYAFLRQQYRVHICISLLFQCRNLPQASYAGENSWEIGNFLFTIMLGLSEPNIKFLIATPFPFAEAFFHNDFVFYFCDLLTYACVLSNWIVFGSIDHITWVVLSMSFFIFTIAFTFGRAWVQHFCRLYVSFLLRVIIMSSPSKSFTKVLSIN